MPREIMENKPAWVDEESICRRCGRCCHRKEKSFGKINILPETCRFLEKTGDGKTRCGQYEHRFAGPLFFKDGQAFFCLPAQQAFQMGLLPNDCPYVHYYKHGMDKQLKHFLVFNNACDTQKWDGIFPKPKPNCKHCYGRGYLGRDVNRNTYVPCYCLSYQEDLCQKPKSPDEAEPSGGELKSSPEENISISP